MMIKPALFCAALLCALALPVVAKAQVPPMPQPGQAAADTSPRPTPGKIQPLVPVPVPGFTGTGASDGAPCQKLDRQLKFLIAERSLAYMAQAIDSKGLVHMWFMSRDRREWASVTVDSQLTACITAQGTDFRFALE